MKRYPYLISTFCALALSLLTRGSEGSKLLFPEVLLFLFSLMVGLILVYRINGRRGGKELLFFLISFLLFFFSALVRLYLLDHLFPFFGGVTLLFLKNFASGSSSGELSGPPPLESSSSTESLATYRNIIAAENEAAIYQSIRALEGSLYYNIPPQNADGEYESLVREHFDQALNVDHFLLIFDKDTFYLRVLEQKGVLQDRLFELMLSQDNLQRIFEVCLHKESDIRKEAYDFLQNKVEPFSDPSFADQRARMSQTLNSFTQQLNEHGRNS